MKHYHFVHGVLLQGHPANKLIKILKINRSIRLHVKIISRTVYLPKQKQTANMVQQSGGSFVQHRMMLSFNMKYGLFQELFYLIGTFHL